MKDMYDDLQDSLEYSKAQKLRPAAQEEPEEDDEIAQAAFEEKLLKQEAQNKAQRQLRKENINPKISEEVDSNGGGDVYDSLEREEYERQLLADQNNKSKMKRTGDKVGLKEMVDKSLENKKSKIIPPEAPPPPSQETDEKTRREIQLKFLKQKQEEAKKINTDAYDGIQIEGEWI